ncbi:MAG TPA: serine protease [Burkholderiaceae bacterium]|nr:serine protease [Burkholderiaceae bacterium]
MGSIAPVLRPLMLACALIAGLPASARADTVAAKPEVASPVSAQGQRIYEATRAQLLQVRTLLKDQDSQASVGSGFVVDDSGLAITNYHVVSQFALRPERYRLAFTMAQGRSGTVELLAIDVINDLALVRLRSAAGAPPIDFTALQFRDGVPLAKGERLYSLGNPLDVGFAVAEGVYNGPVERSFLPRIFFGGSLNPGMSGGPAVDDRGRVIGVNVAARRDGEQVSFLVPAQPALELLQRARDAKPQTQPMYAEVTRQLKAHQAALVDAFVAQPWRSAHHPRYRVPVPQETFMRCWGSTSPETQKYMRFERSDCVMNHSVYATPQLRGGMINVRHESYDGDRLGTLRFAQEYSASFANENFGGGFSATAPRCREGFTDRDGLILRTVACISALKRFDGLYNLSVLTTTVDHPTQGVQGRLDAVAVDFANALRLTEHYMQGFGWNTKADPR